MPGAEVMPLPAARLKESEKTRDSVNGLVLQHYDTEHLALRRYLRLMGIEDATAQEIVQDTFLKLHQHLSTGGGDSNVRAWLYRVAHNLALNEHQSARRRRTQPMDGKTDWEELASDRETPEQQVMANEKEMRLRRAIAQLSAAQRECLVLRSEGMKYREIAGILDISVASVGENVHRGLEKLKGLL
jgi:RNA polymerase sigma-70 factor (ECF subfamily)